eukprot:GILI01006538.1.p1 GENE.GILI01006538.1~~GILI01006538.1.p1  ORF type:complete len:536 (-),score=146.90 GILI01006538.1:95-1702(-)
MGDALDLGGDEGRVKIRVLDSKDTVDMSSIKSWENECTVANLFVATQFFVKCHGTFVYKYDDNFHILFQIQDYGGPSLSKYSQEKMAQIVNDLAQQAFHSKKPDTAQAVESVRAEINKKATSWVNMAVAVYIQMLAGVRELTNKHMSHHDIKPDNVVVSDTILDDSYPVPKIKFIDLGVAVPCFHNIPGRLIAYSPPFTIDGDAVFPQCCYAVDVSSTSLSFLAVLFGGKPAIAHRGGMIMLPSVMGLLDSDDSLYNRFVDSLSKSTIDSIEPLKQQAQVAQEVDKRFKESKEGKAQSVEEQEYSDDFESDPDYVDDFESDSVMENAFLETASAEGDEDDEVDEDGDGDDDSDDEDGIFTVNMDEIFPDRAPRKVLNSYVDLFDPILKALRLAIAEDANSRGLFDIVRSTMDDENPCTRPPPNRLIEKLAKVLPGHSKVQHIRQSIRGRLSMYLSKVIEQGTLHLDNSVISTPALGEDMEENVKVDLIAEYLKVMKMTHRASLPSALRKLVHTNRVQRRESSDIDEMSYDNGIKM